MPRHKHHGGGHQKRHQKSAKHPKPVSASAESVPTPPPSSSMTKTQKRGRKRQRQQQQHDKQQPQHAPAPAATSKHKRQKHKHSPQRNQTRQRHTVGGSGGAGGGAGAGVGGKVAPSASPSAAQPQPQPKAQRRRLKGEALWSIRTPLPPLYKYSGSKPFLSPGDDEYDAAKETSYGGFHVDGAAAMPQQVHKVVHAALEEMRRKGLFHYDVVAAGGSGRKAAVSSTFVQRVLVGRRGMTYHYQVNLLSARTLASIHSPGTQPSNRSCASLHCRGMTSTQSQAIPCASSDY